MDKTSFERKPSRFCTPLLFHFFPFVLFHFILNFQKGGDIFGSFFDCKQSNSRALAGTKHSCVLFSTNN